MLALMNKKFTIQTNKNSNQVEIDQDIFNNVADKYDLMNDLMSFYLHRYWKRKAINHANINKHTRALDLATGTGDLAKLVTKKIINQGGNSNQVTVTDINPQMLELGGKKLKKAGFNVNHLITNAEVIPFRDNSFDLVTIGFGIRNVVNKKKALAEIYRVLNMEGQLIILEFSQINKLLAPFYHLYSFYWIPFLARLVVGDCQSYRYLVESIRTHPNQEQLKNMMENCGLQDVKYINLAFGGVAIHFGTKIS